MSTTPPETPLTTTPPPRPKRRRPDIAGLIAGTLIAGGATIWILYDQDVVGTHEIGLSIALLLVVSGVLGLAASGRN
jgi:hypothetical protein